MIELATCRRILIFGGSFDPPHWAHVRLPMLARLAIDADVVAYVPTARQPLKTDRTLTEARHRLRMLELALADQPHAAIVTDELDRRDDNQPSYTVDTLEHLRERLGPAPEFRLLIGADQLRVFDRWRAPGRVIELAQPVVMIRPPDTRERLLLELPSGYNRQEWSNRIVDLPQLKISATEVRRRVAAGEPIDDLVSPAVAAYIREHHLYR